MPSWRNVQVLLKESDQRLDALNFDRPLFRAVSVRMVAFGSFDASKTFSVCREKLLKVCPDTDHRRRRGGVLPERVGRFYFNELLIEPNLSLRLVPRPLTTAMIANAIPAAISPYSIAVAPF